LEKLKLLKRGNLGTSLTIDKSNMGTSEKGSQHSEVLPIIYADKSLAFWIFRSVCHRQPEVLKQVFRV